MNAADHIHAGQRRDALHHLAIKSPLARAFLIGRGRRRDLQREHVLRFESGINLLSPPEAFD